MLDLLNVLKSLHMNNYENIGFAIGYGDIFNAFTALGFNNSELLNYELRKLSDNGLIELFCIDNFDKNLICAVKLKQFSNPLHLRHSFYHT